MVEVRKTLEQRVLEAAAPMEALRFSIMTNLEAENDTEMSKDSSPIMHAGEKVSVWFIFKIVG